MTARAAENLSLEEMDKQSLLHPYTLLAQHLRTGPRVIVEAKGVEIADSHGRRYIDALAGLWCVNVGWGREEMAEAIAAQARKLAYYHEFASMSNEPAIRLAHRLLPLLPGRMSKIFFGNSGSDANDTEVKLVWYYNNLRGRPAKKKIISRKRAYHGVTVAAASLTGLPIVHQAFDLPLPGILHTETPHYYRYAEPGMSEEGYAKSLAEELDRLIEAEGPDTVAAFIAEPVMGAGGVITPPAGYFREIQKVLKKHDVLMIADEVICGFGRLGKMFGSFVYDIEPDIITMAKGLTSGYVPMSASAVSEDVWAVLVEGSPKVGPFGHGYTYSGHPVAAAAGLTSLDIIEREGLVENAARVGEHLQRRLRESFSDHPLVGEVRGLGLVAGIELVADKAKKEPFDGALKVAARLAAKCLDEGLIVRALMHTDTVAFSPPLVISETEVEEIIARFGRGLAKLSDELVREAAWKGA